ncbi:hypothetical protein PoB_002486500 [Plakobranchus ocellatus]|uniref:Uncharacterized protein n=1 Tax=Plakobranchus ocellatus TaxID=259542 RepID=A0AAV3ZRH9_9GAST|nr:hypothetical protein PoB_002486500 [Plakobranchus ocellatus]
MHESALQATPGIDTYLRPGNVFIPRDDSSEAEVGWVTALTAQHTGRPPQAQVFCISRQQAAQTTTESVARDYVRSS